MIVKWGIIGCGDVANRKGGPALINVERSELVAVASRTPERAREFAARHGAKRYYRTVEELLSDDEINAIYIATPPNVHCKYTVLAAEAGKHVLCEKPMAMNVRECEEMIRACRRNNVKLMVAYYRRGYPNVQWAKRFIEHDVIGEVVLAKVNATGYYNPENPNDPKHWRTNPEIAGGGVLMDFGCHYLDLLLYLFGDVTHVKALTETLHCSYSVEDSALLILKFKRGMHGLANFNWNIGVSELSFEIYGTQGKISLIPGDVSMSGDLIVYTKKEGRREIHLKPLQITHQAIVKNFVDSLSGEEELLCPGEEAIKTNKIIEAAYQSSRNLWSKIDLSSVRV